ncbi:MAG: purine-nucleoside phosphorylase [Desulfurococcaceae archaeon TW002]
MSDTHSKKIVPVHLKIREGGVAERVLMAGDPARVKYLSELLDDVKLVNESRGFLTYTGYYKGFQVTIATHGIGMPSALIVLEELIAYGGKYFVRLGTAGALVSGLRIGDVIIPTGAAHYPGGVFKQYYGENVCGPLTPDFTLLRKIVEVAEEKKMKYVLGPVFSSDAFYAEDPVFAKKWSSRGLVAVEMECAGLFAVSLMRGVKTACVLVISNSLVEDLGHASAEDLKEKVIDAARTVLEALIRI